MKRRVTAITGLATLLTGCVGVLVNPITMQLVMTVLLAAGNFIARTAVYMTVEAFMDEVVRPKMREFAHTVSGGVEVDRYDPLHGVLRGKITFTRTDPLPPKDIVLGAVGVIRHTSRSSWQIEPEYVQNVKHTLEADVVTVKVQR